MRFRKTKAFTLIEWLIVIVLIDAVAVFAIYSYQETKGQEQERRAVINLASIRDALKIYLVSGRDPAYGVWGDIDTVDEKLNLNIEDAEIEYACEALTPEGWPNYCQAEIPGHWRVRFWDGLSVHCENNDCPTCRTWADGGCRYGY